MLKHTKIRGRSRALTKTHKLSIAGVAAIGAAAIAFTAVPGQAHPTADKAAVMPGQVALGNQPAKDYKVSVTDQLAADRLKAEAIAAKQQAAQKTAAQRKAHEAASRSGQRVDLQPVAAKTYADNLDGWIHHALDIMGQRKIPGSYNGLHRNIMRESSGNPKAINDWDINARMGIPSKGLLQVIDPTFNAYHVAGTSYDIYDPVANITAAANYAAHRYGSIDNVNSAY